MHRLRGNVNPGDPVTEINGDVIGLNEISESSQGRIVTHELSDGTYLIRSQGSGPSTVTWSGEIIGDKVDGISQIESLRRLRGRRVAVYRDNLFEGFGHVQSVNRTYETRMYNKFVKITWRCDLLMEITAPGDAESFYDGEDFL